jgi:hypothetical protein
MLTYVRKDKTIHEQVSRFILGKTTWHCIHFVFTLPHCQLLRLRNIELYDELMNTKSERMPYSDLRHYPRTCLSDRQTMKNTGQDILGRSAC